MNDPVKPETSEPSATAPVRVEPVVMPRQEILTNFPGMKAIAESNGEYFRWRASYNDGSGAVEGWSPTMRGAKLQAINQCRRKSGNYSKVKFKWYNNQAQTP